MNEATFLQIQALELERLLEKCADDPILAPQLRDRLDDARRALQRQKEQSNSLIPREPAVLPRGAIFIRGVMVHGSEGTRLSLVGEALIQYERLFVAQALHDERVAAKDGGRQRRRRGAATPGLLFTGSHCGSFGLEFVPQFLDDEALLAVHKQSLVNVADALARVAESDAGSLDALVRQLPPRVLACVNEFVKTLAQHDADLRLAFHDRPSISLTASQIKSAAELLERHVAQSDVSVEGVFRGVTLESMQFDVELDDDSVITGTVSDQLDEEDLKRLAALTSRRCKADLHRTTIRNVGDNETSSYLLLDAQAVGASA